MEECQPSMNYKLKCETLKENKQIAQLKITYQRMGFIYQTFSIKNKFFIIHDNKFF